MWHLSSSDIVAVFFIFFFSRWGKNGETEVLGWWRVGDGEKSRQREKLRHPPSSAPQWPSPSSHTPSCFPDRAVRPDCWLGCWGLARPATTVVKMLTSRKLTGWGTDKRTCTESFCTHREFKWKKKWVKQNLPGWRWVWTTRRMWGSSDSEECLNIYCHLRKLMCRENRRVTNGSASSYPLCQRHGDVSDTLNSSQHLHELILNITHLQTFVSMWFYKGGGGASLAPHKAAIRLMQRSRF